MSGEDEVEGEVEETGPGALIRYSHKVSMLDNREINGETTFLVRLRRETDHHLSFFMKTDKDFVELQHQLQKDSENRMWGEATEVHVIPDMPTPGRFGVRKRLSALGMNDFVAAQAEQIQQAMDQLMFQITDLSKDSTLTSFFTESTDQETQDVIDAWVLPLRQKLYLLAAMGFWRLAGSERTWTVHGDGTASLDGRRQGDLYDFIEEGSPCSLDRTITRKDGWSVDLERSCKDKLFWVSPGKKDLVWVRLKRDDAEEALRKVDEIKLTMRKKKEEEQQQEEDAEKARIREAILERAAAARLGKAAATDKAGEELVKAASTIQDEQDEAATTASTTASDDKAAEAPPGGKDVAKTPIADQEGDEDAASKATSCEQAAAAPPEAEAVAQADTPAEVPEGSD